MVISEIPLNELKSGLSQLEGSVRAELAEFLIRSLGAPPDSRTDEEFEADLNRRLDDMRCGRVQGRPAREALAEIREKFS